VLYVNHLLHFAPYLLACFVATLLRDVGHFRKFVQFWPTLDQIIDWEKADRVTQTRTAGLQSMADLKSNNNHALRQRQQTPTIIVHPVNPCKKTSTQPTNTAAARTGKPPNPHQTKNG
jgi:hypothetical protein